MADMTTNDMGLLGGGLLITLAATYMAQTGMLSEATIGLITTWLPRLTVVVILGAAALIYRSRTLYGGEIERSLEIISAGFLIYGVVYWPHKIGWHGANEPAWISISAGAWQTFFHFLTVTTLGIVAYGFYRFWRIGQE